MKADINIGDRVEFAQQYLPSLPEAQLLGEEGIVLDINGIKAQVEFEDWDLGVKIVLLSDLERINEATLQEVKDSGLLVDLLHTDKNILIRDKLQAQESDPELDKYINVALCMLAL